MTRGYWIWKTIGAENRWSILGMAMFRPFLAILGIVYDISFLSSKNDLPSTEHVFINKNRDNSATNIGETWWWSSMARPKGQQMTRPRRGRLAWSVRVLAEPNKWEGPLNWGPLGMASHSFFVRTNGGFWIFSDFSGFWDEFWKCFHGMTMSLELVDAEWNHPQ